LTKPKFLKNVKCCNISEKCLKKSKREKNGVQHFKKMLTKIVDEINISKDVGTFMKSVGKNLQKKC
jgi:hypothetical protein